MRKGVGGSGGEFGIKRIHLVLQGPKKQGPNYFGLEQSKAFGQKHANVTTPLRIGFVDSFHQPLVPPSSILHSSLFVLSFYNTHHHFFFNFSSTPFPFSSHLLLVCLVHNSLWSHTLATSFVVAWSKLRACPSSSVVMAKARSQLRFPRGAPSSWLGLSSSLLSSPAL